MKFDNLTKQFFLTKIKYVNKIKDNLFKDSEIPLYRKLKFVSIITSENKPSDNIDKYIEKTYLLYTLSLIFGLFGILFIIASIIAGLYPIILVGVGLIILGFLDNKNPYKIFKFLVESDFSSREKSIVSSRFQIIRKMYHNYLMKGNIVFIDDYVKNNIGMYTVFRFLEFEEGVSYEKISNMANYFNDLTLQKFFKDVSLYLKDQNIKSYYESNERDLEANNENIIKEKATTFSSIVTILIFFVGIGGLLIGIGSIVQPLMTQIYNSVIANFSSYGAASQISTELGFFQVIIGIPPIYYGYALILIIGVIGAIIISSFAKKTAVI